NIIHCTHGRGNLDGQHTLKITVLILGFCCAAPALADLYGGPDCAGLFCGGCGTNYEELEETSQISTPGPTLGLLPETVWASCPPEGNCCGTSNCTLTWQTESASAGIWTTESGISVGLEAPSGYSMEASGVVKYEGQSSV